MNRDDWFDDLETLILEKQNADPYEFDKLLRHFKENPNVLQNILVELRKDKIDKIKNK